MAAAVAAACATSTTTGTYTPITGIIIRASSLVAGIGCGMNDGAANQPLVVYRYAAVVTYQQNDAGTTSDAGSPAIWSNIFDCYVDGVFENLPTGPNGDLNFNVTIFAYDAAAYAAAGLPPVISCVPGAVPGCTARTQPLSQDQENAATWSVSCTATQQQGVPVLAVCDPLLPTPAGLRAGAGPAPDATAPPIEAEAPDAPTGDAPAGEDGSPDAHALPDAAPDAAPDASDAAAEPSADGGDAGPDAPADG